MLNDRRFSIVQMSHLQHLLRVPESFEIALGIGLRSNGHQLHLDALVEQDRFFEVESVS